MLTLFAENSEFPSIIFHGPIPKKGDKIYLRLEQLRSQCIKVVVKDVYYSLQQWDWKPRLCYSKDDGTIEDTNPKNEMNCEVIVNIDPEDLERFKSLI